jgi:GAF domain-containing protein
MTTPQTDAITDPQRIITALRQQLEEQRAERDAALVEKAVLAKELAARTAELGQRNTEYGERINHQTATIDVLQAMSASPADPRPVFDLIARHANELCNGTGCAIHEFDGNLVHLRTSQHGSGIQSAVAEYLKLFPMAPTRGSFTCRAILDKQMVHITDTEADGAAHPAVRALGYRSQLSIPLMRDGKAIGAISLGGALGGFSASQIALLQTFAEQAAIAISSAETYRALQTRTSDLQETLEYQTATSDVLKVISRSTFDLQPVLDTVAETAARLCDADQAAIARAERGEMWLVANFGFPPEYETDRRSRGRMPIDPTLPIVAYRAVLEKRLVHVPDVATVPGYSETAITLGRQRTSLGVPLMREGVVIGVIILARQRVEPFTNRQIEVVSTFADQAVIVIENTRLITEQREALEQQTATADVLRVINGSPGDLIPVFNAILEWAHRVCDADGGVLYTYDGTHVRMAAVHGFPSDYAAGMLARAPYPPPNTVVQQMIATGRFIQVEDVQTALQWIAASHAQDLAVPGMRTAAAIPLLKDGRLIGYITAWRRDVRLVSDKEIALLENFAAQAVIAMENARLLTETREALEQQTATAEVLQVINASPGDLAPVFDAMLEKAMRLCGSAFGSLYTYDGARFLSAAQRGVPPAYAEFRARHPPTLAKGGGVAALVETRKPVHILDTAAHELYRAGQPGVRAMVGLGGVRTSLIVPLLKDDAVLGFISIYRQEVRAYSDKQIALLQNFAAQAVIAMENAGLLTEQREALEQHTATAEVLQVINASPGNLAPVFDAMLEKALRLCGAAFGILSTYDGERIHTAASRGATPTLADFLREPIRPRPGMGLYRLVNGEDTVHVADITDEETYRSGAPGPKALADLGGARAVLLVALRKDGALLGAINIFRQEVRPFSDKQIALLQNFAAQAVIAMENARLIAEQREALEQQTATAEILQVINASPGNLAPVFDAMLEKAMRLCGAAFGLMSTYDGGRFQRAAERGVPAALTEFTRRNAGSGTVYGPGTAPALLVDGANLVHNADLMAEEVYQQGEPNRRALVDLGGARSHLSVALRKDQMLLGYLAIYRQEVRPFSDKEVALLENFAAQAVIAMENARLLDQIRQRQDELRITFENMGDGVALFDETPCLVAWNQHFQEIFNLPVDLLEQHRTYEEHLRFLAARGDFGSGLDADEQLRTLVATTDRPSIYERTRPDGRVLEIRRNPVPSGGFVLIFSDITERKRSEEAIRAARDAAEEASRTIEVS